MMVRVLYHGCINLAHEIKLFDNANPFLSESCQNLRALLTCCKRVCYAQGSQVVSRTSLTSCSPNTSILSAGR